MILKDKNFTSFLLKFLLVFCVLYLGTLAVIGLSAPGKYYSGFVDHYLDYVSGLKNLLLYSTKGTLALFGINTKIEPGYIIRFPGARGVIIAMSCVGYGVYSFWIAYVAANRSTATKKISWILLGLLLLFVINSVRITLFLVAINKGWPMPLGIDHHTWFNIFAYAAIFLLMLAFERSLKKTTVSIPVA